LKQFILRNSGQVTCLNENADPAHKQKRIFLWVLTHLKKTTSLQNKLS